MCFLADANVAVKRCLAQGSPVISVDTQKKELIGNYDNAGQQWLAAKRPTKVRGHDFPTPDVPRAYPYGIYDVGRNTGFVNVGTDHDTGAFAVASIRGWWRQEGKRFYPAATKVLITADGGGSNGWRLRLWKLELQTNRPAPLGLSFPTWDEQVEQDRAPPFFLHLVELAWRTPARLRNRRPSHCQDDDGERTESDLPIGPLQISNRPQSHPGRNEGHQSSAG